MKREGFDVESFLNDLKPKQNHTQEDEEYRETHGDPMFRKWQNITFTLMFLTYISIYFCRSDLTVDGPILDKENGPIGSKTKFGVLIGMGTLFYGIGKAASGFINSSLGAKYVVLISTFGTALFSLLFVFGDSLWWFVYTWSMNRFMQSIIWSTLVQILMKWYKPSVFGGMVGALSLSFLVGDALARVVLGGVLESVGWRGVFVIASIVVTVLGVLNVFFLRPTPVAAGFSPLPHTYDSDTNNLNNFRYNESVRVSMDDVIHFSHNSRSVVSNNDTRATSSGTTNSVVEQVEIDQSDLDGEIESKEADIQEEEQEEEERQLTQRHDTSGNKAASENHLQSNNNKTILRIIFGSPEFYVICLMNGGMNFVREVFRDWLPILLSDRTSISEEKAALYSIVYPIAGALSAVLCGTVTDRLADRRRGLVMSIFMLIGAGSIFLLWFSLNVKGNMDTTYTLLLSFFIGFGIYGPYTMLTTLSIDLNMDHERSFPGITPIFQGLQDSAGYIAATLSGILIGEIADANGWATAVFTLFCISGGTFVVTLLFLVREKQLKEGGGRQIIVEDFLDDLDQVGTEFHFGNDDDVLDTLEMEIEELTR